MCKKLVINYFNTTLGEIKFYGRKVKYYINIEKFIPNQNYTEILTKVVIYVPIHPNMYL
jgi:hypothetical protein